MKKVVIVIITMSLILTTGCAQLSGNPSSNITVERDTSNLFFFNSNVSQLKYKGGFLFDDIIEKDVILNINEIAELKYGKLYELKLDPVEGVPNERLNLGYFYVEEDKIYKIEPTEENLNKLKTTKELPTDSTIVCQDKEMKDNLNKDELGWHQYIEVDGDKRVYNSYNNQTDTGYYESFTWGKNKGLTYYKSGFGAESDSIELQLSFYLSVKGMQNWC